MVRPIDMVDNLAKTPAAEKVNSVQKSAPDMEQRQYAAQVEEKQTEKREKTAPMPRTDEVIISGDPRKKEEKKEEKKKKKDQEKGSDSHLDLTA